MDEYTFIGFDCAYRTLGWCILGYNPRALTECLTTSPTTSSTTSSTKSSKNVSKLEMCARNLFHLRASGVVDVLGATIEEVDHSTRAILLAQTLRSIIPADIISRATVIIEKQPRKLGRQFAGAHTGSVHDSNQTVEAQLIYHFSVLYPARRVYLVSPNKKNQLACSLLHEDHVTTYSARKKQSRRAFMRMAELFNFDVVAPIIGGSKKETMSSVGDLDSDLRPRFTSISSKAIRHIKADQADACIQIVAAIILCPEYI